MVCDKKYIRKAQEADLGRIAEIYVFNNRMDYYPIIRSEAFSFGQLQVIPYADRLRENSDNIYVYDDGVIKGFILLDGEEIKKLHVEYFFQHRGIGSALIEYAKATHAARVLWTLEKNKKALRFYQQHGFRPTGNKRPLTDLGGQTKYCVELAIE